MATTLSGSLSVGLNLTESATAAGGTTKSGQTNYTYGVVIAPGATTGLFDCCYAVQTTLAGSGSVTVDLSGVLLDLFGTAVNFARLNYMWINLTDTTAASSVAVGNAAATPLDGWISTVTYTVKVLNDGMLLIGDNGTGYPVVNAATDKIKILNNDGALSAYVNHLYLGRSA